MKNEFYIDKNCDWYFRGNKVEQQEMICLFSSLLSMDKNGSYYLCCPENRSEVTVADAPFMMTEFFRCGCGENQNISFKTNIDEIVPLDKDHPMVFKKGSNEDELIPYVFVKKGLWAKLSRKVFYALSELVDKRDVCDKIEYGIWSGGQFFKIEESKKCRELS